MLLSADLKSSGENTLVNIRLDGLWRRVSLSRGCIEDHLQLEPAIALAMSEDERCEFVRSNLAYVFAAARRKIKGREDAERIWLESGDL
jgi:hypothetical protein